MPASNVAVQKMGTVALSGQGVQWAKLEAVSTNLSNAQTAGFKALAVLPQAVTYHKTGQPDIAYSRHTHVVRDLTAGSFRHTGDPLHVAITGQGYFQVQTPEGMRYTRDGRFTRSADGRLVTPRGYSVLSAGGGEITIPNGGKISIASDGAISTDGIVINQVGVLGFENEGKLAPVGYGVYEAAADAQPAVVTGDVVLSGGFEESNVQPVQEMVKMIQILRQYENIEKLSKVEDDQERKAINLRVGA